MNIKKMESTVKVWIARDKDGKLYAYSERPNKMVTYRWVDRGFNSFELDCTKFPTVKWEDDEPTEDYITRAEPQEQPQQEHPAPKQEIDWEQRRYEIAKDILQSLVADIVVENVVDDKEMFAKYAINIADTLINELKEKSE